MGKRVAAEAMVRASQRPKKAENTVFLDDRRKHPLREQTLTANDLSFVEGPPPKSKDERKSFNSVYWTPTGSKQKPFFGFFYVAYTKMVVHKRPYIDSC